MLFKFKSFCHLKLLVGVAALKHQQGRNLHAKLNWLVKTPIFNKKKNLTEAILL